MIIDRDGIINYDYGYVGSISRFRFIEYNLIELSRLAKKYTPLIITNQSGIARGLYTEAEFYELTEWMNSEIDRRYGFNIINLYYCPHHPEYSSKNKEKNCSCRKPGIDLFTQAISENNLNVKESITIGDNLRDLIPGDKLGFRDNYLLSEKKVNHDSNLNIKIISNLSEIK